MSRNNKITDIFKTDILLKASPVLIFVFSLTYGLISEKIPDDNYRGFFFGQLGRWVRDLDLAWKFQIDSYSLKHVFPAVLLHYLFIILGIEPTDINIVFGFIVAQAFCYGVIAFLWIKVSKRLDLSAPAQLTGLITFVFTLLFKISMFMPISRDAFPQALSLLMLYGWLTHNYFVQFMSMAMFSFTLPQGVVTAFILFLFQYKPKLKQDRFTPAKSTKASSLYATMFLLAPIAYGMYHYNPDFLKQYSLTVKPVTALLSQMLTFLLLAAVTYQTIRRRPLARFFMEFDIAVLLRLALALTLVTISAKLQLFFASHEELAAFTSPITLTKIYFWINATYHPGLFFVLLVINFGPAALLAVHCFNDFIDILYKHGFALVVIFMMTVFRSIEGEPRHLVDAIPILWPFLLLSIEKYLTRRNIVFLVCMTFLFSRIWIDLGYDYPNFFFWYSYTCNTTGYIVQSLAVLATYCAMFFLFPREKGTAGS